MRSAKAEQSAAGLKVDPADLIALRLKARALDLGLGKRATSAVAGIHASRFRGRGVDYQESRVYQAGDDIRNMDWRVTARSGTPHTKLFQEERERPVMVMVDLSPTMYFATRRALKVVAAVEAAALVAWATVRQGDRIGGFLYGRGEHHELAPTGGRRGVLRLIRSFADQCNAGWEIEEVDESDRLGSALNRLRRVIRPGSLIYIFSDFYGANGDTERHLSRLREHNDMVACQVLDPVELTLPPAGRYGVTSRGQAGLLDLTRAGTRQRYQEFFEAHRERVDRLFGRRGIPVLRMTTESDPLDVLRSGLAMGPPMRAFQPHKKTRGAA